MTDETGGSLLQPDLALLTLDRVVHEPARLLLLGMLANAEEIEFRFFENSTGLTKGNLSSHLGKLEEAGYVSVRKAFRGKVPVTSYCITLAGRSALREYRDRLRRSLITLAPKENGPPRTPGEGRAQRRRRRRS